MKRHIILAIGTTVTLLTAYLATSHCCARLNILAIVGLAAPG